MALELFDIWCQPMSDAVFIIVAADFVSGFLHGFQAVGYRNADTAGAEHVDIVIVIAKGNHLIQADSVPLRQQTDAA